MSHARSANVAPAAITDPARALPVIHEADAWVLGGIATTAMVNIWHSLWDTEGKRQIIAGLTEEVLAGLERRGAALRFERTNPNRGFTVNSEELKIDLDELTRAAGLKIYLHTQLAAPLFEVGRLAAVAVENKSGRGAIRARVFIDATGDADLAARLGCETYLANQLQPATACARFSAWDTLGDTAGRLGQLLRDHGPAHGLPSTFAWGTRVPGAHTYMLAATRVHGINPALPTTSPTARSRAAARSAPSWTSSAPTPPRPASRWRLCPPASACANRAISDRRIHFPVTISSPAAPSTTTSPRAATAWTYITRTSPASPSATSTAPRNTAHPARRMSAAAGVPRPRPIRRSIKFPTARSCPSGAPKRHRRRPHA